MWQIERVAGGDKTNPTVLAMVKDQWSGKDPDVDRAIDEKWPNLLTDDQRAAIGRTRAESVETTVEAVAVAGMMDARTNGGPSREPPVTSNKLDGLPEIIRGRRPEITAGATFVFDPERLMGGELAARSASNAQPVSVLADTC